MTRKKYEADDINDEMLEHQQSKLLDKEQAEYDEYSRIEENASKLLEQRLDESILILKDIKENCHNFDILDKCIGNNIFDFICNPSYYDNIDKHVDYYKKMVWFEENKPELKSHYNALNKYFETFGKQRITLIQFMNFCYLYSNHS